MIIKRHKKFEKLFKKLSDKDKKAVIRAVDFFMDDPHDIRLNNHALKGKMSGLKSISVKGDLRIVFKEFDNYVLVLFLSVGKHNKVYK